jgi:hypothetical protein
MSRLHIRLIGESDVTEVDGAIWRDCGPFCEKPTAEHLFQFGRRRKDAHISWHLFSGVQGRNQANHESDYQTELRRLK